MGSIPFIGTLLLHGDRALHSLPFFLFATERCFSNVLYLPPGGVGADIAFFLGGGAPLRNGVIVFRIPVVLESRRLSRGGGGGGSYTPLVYIDISPGERATLNLSRMLKILLRNFRTF